MIPLAAMAAVLFLSCGPPNRQTTLPVRGGETFEPVAIYQSAGNVVLGEPLALSLDLRGDIFVADGLPGRVIHFIKDGSSALEFETPKRNPGFYPCDLAAHGFFLYTIDEVGRMLLRFDQDGAYRDILLNFNQEILGRRISPYGMDVDPSGRVVITDIENHQILIFDSYLSLESAFGNFGSYPGQMDSPQGVSLTKTGELVVADTGNRRVQFFEEGGNLLRVVPLEDQNNPLVAPRRAVLDESGRLYVADPEAGRLFLFDKAGVLAQSLSPAGKDDFRPTDVEVMRDGMVYVTDAASRSLFVFKVMSY
jgi:hypothetical protein